MNKHILKGKLKYEGLTFKTKACGDVLVLEYNGALSVDVKFIDTGYTTTTRVEDLNNGTIKDYLKPSVFGVGILGAPNKTKGGLSKEYTIWCRVLERCYDGKRHKNYQTYEQCTVSDNFRHFLYFEEWCEAQVGFSSKDGKGKPFALDKDILLKGNKIYSEDTCCFVPQEVNSLFVKSNARRGECLVGVTYRKDRKKYKAGMNNTEGSSFIGHFDTELEAFQAYKQAKESKVKEVAELYKDRIDPRVYEALMNYVVEITD